MKRGDARELAVHLIYGRAFTGEEPEQVVSTRLNKEYYEKLAEEMRYMPSALTGSSCGISTRWSPALPTGRMSWTT